MCPTGYRADQRGKPGGFIGDPDVMDTWATSSLSPQIGCGWPRRCGSVRADVPDGPASAGARHHPHVAVFDRSCARTSNTTRCPGPTRRSPASSLDPDRKKMSKSKGNVVTPMALLEEHGSDGVRYWAGERPAGSRHGVRPEPDAGRPAAGDQGAERIEVRAGARPSRGTADRTEPVDRAMLRSLARARRRRRPTAFEDYDYARVLQRTETFFWRFCDDYLELVKGRRYGEQDRGRRGLGQRGARRRRCRRCCGCSRRSCRFVTEEVWSWWQAGFDSPARRWPTSDELLIAHRRQPRCHRARPTSATYRWATDVLFEVRKQRSEAKQPLKIPITSVLVKADAGAPALDADRWRRSARPRCACARSRRASAIRGNHRRADMARPKTPRAGPARATGTAARSPMSIVDLCAARLTKTLRDAATSRRRPSSPAKQRARGRLPRSRRTASLAGLDVALENVSSTAIRSVKIDGAQRARHGHRLSIGRNRRQTRRRRASPARSASGRRSISCSGSAGIATHTRRFVDAAEGAHHDPPTRARRTPTLRALGECAVRVRWRARTTASGLFDAVLIKDNHVRLAGGVTQSGRSGARASGPGLPIEVEAQTLARKWTKRSRPAPTSILRRQHGRSTDIRKAVDRARAGGAKNRDLWRRHARSHSGAGRRPAPTSCRSARSRIPRRPSTSASRSDPSDAAAGSRFLGLRRRDRAARVRASRRSPRRIAVLLAPSARRTTGAAVDRRPRGRVVVSRRADAPDGGSRTARPDVVFAARQRTLHVSAVARAGAGAHRSATRDDAADAGRRRGARRGHRGEHRASPVDREVAERSAVVAAASWPASWRKRVCVDRGRARATASIVGRDALSVATCAIAPTSLETELGRAVDRARCWPRRSPRSRALRRSARRPVRCYSRRVARAARPAASRRARHVDTPAGRAIGRDRRHRRSRALLVRRSRPTASSGSSADEVDAGFMTEASMLLAIDVGNTNIVLGVFDGDHARPELAAADAARADVRRARAARRRACSRTSSHRAVADSRRDPRVGRAAADRHDARRWSQRYFGVTALDRRAGRQHRDADPLREPRRGRRRSHSSTRSPRYETFGRAAGQPMIVVDFGTATTLDAITAKGEYLGGAICPGVQISADALFQRAARAAAHRRAQAVARSSAGPRSARCSRGCSTATSAWSRGWSGA